MLPRSRIWNIQPQSVINWGQSFSFQWSSLVMNADRHLRQSWAAGEGAAENLKHRARKRNYSTNFKIFYLVLLSNALAQVSLPSMGANPRHQPLVKGWWSPTGHKHNWFTCSWLSVVVAVLYLFYPHAVEISATCAWVIQKQSWII